MGLLLREGEGKEWGKEWGKGRERKERGREGEVRERIGPQVTVEPGPLRALLRHCIYISIT